MKYSTYIASFSLLLCGALALTGCKEPIPGESLELVDFSISSVVKTDPADDPYADVAFIRIAVNDSDGKLISDKFVHYEPGSIKALDSVPFGSNLQLMVEGWSQNAQGLIGQLISRGKSSRFSVTSSSDPVSVNVTMARVNAFSYTTAKTSGGPQATGLSTGRVGHTVTLLNDGRVLIAGGAILNKNGDFVAPEDLSAVYDSAEIYDPNTGLFAPIPGAMSQARAFHTATKMDDGRIALVGGFTDTAGTASNTIEIFDPSTSAFTPLVGQALNTGRAAHTTSRIEGTDHLVVAGGYTGSGTLSVIGTIEVFCTPGYPCQDAGGPGVVYTDQMSAPRAFHSANRVAVGASNAEAVVFVGGESDQGVLDSLETFVLNPAAVMDYTGVLLSGGRTRHTTTYVDSQKFLHIVGGFSDKNHNEGVQRIDSYQVQSEAFQGSQEFYALHARGGHASVLMPGNAILIFGGYHQGAALNTAEVIFEYFDEASKQTFIDRGGVAAMKTPRGGHHGILLPNDTVLVVGGAIQGGGGATAGEFFNPL